MILAWSHSARDDLSAIFDYLDVRNPKAAFTIENAVFQAVEHLLAMPLMGRSGRVRGTRELVIQNTPYLVVYAVEPEHIFILRVLHGSQNWP